MMETPGNIQEFELSGNQIRILVPVQEDIREQYRQQKVINPSLPFPFWARVWPAARAMAGFISANPGHVKGRIVLELAAGLAMPSLVAAIVAKQVIASDYLPNAVEYIRKSAILNGYTNMQAMQINWNAIPPEIKADVVLLSDVNYDPEEFDQLYKVILTLLKNNTTILLSTPQRLMARPFIITLLPFAVHQETMVIDEAGESTTISILVLNTKSGNI